MRKQIVINDRLLLDETSNELLLRTGDDNDNIQPIKLEHLLADLMKLMAENIGEVVSRGEFIKQIWDNNPNVGNPALTKSISKLRKILRENELSLDLSIETIPKKGYRLSASEEITVPKLPKIELEEKMQQTIFKRNWLRKVALILLIGLAVLILKRLLFGSGHEIMHTMMH